MGKAVAWIRGLFSPCWTAWVALAAVLVCLPTLAAGLILDDHVIAGFVLDHLHGGSDPRAWWNMFDSYGRVDPGEVSRRIALGALPWWSPPSSKLAFLRPLATASHYLDYLLWPRTPWLMHLNNIAWYALVAYLAALLYRRTLPLTAAMLAAVLYAIDEAHVQGVSWIAGRNTVMTTAFVLLTLVVWDRARRERSRLLGVVALLVLLCAHACSEGALAIWPYLFGYAVSFEPRGSRARSLLPLAAVSCGWFALAALGHYGVKGGELYVDPRTTPWVYARFAALRFPQLLRAQLVLPQPLELGLSGVTQAKVVGLSYALIAALALVLLPRLRRDPGTRMFGIGFVGSGLVACTARMDPRLLFICGIGAHALVAQAICECVRSWRGRALVVVLCGLHLALPLAVGPHAARVMPEMDARSQRLAAGLLEASGPRERVFALNAPDLMYAGFAGVYLSFASGGARSLQLLGISQRPVKLSRPSPNAIVLEPEGGYLPYPRARDEYFHDRQVTDTVFWRVTVERATHDGRPLRVRFDVPNADDPHVQWVSWEPRGDRFARAQLPPVGGSLWLPGVAAADGGRR